MVTVELCINQSKSEVEVSLYKNMYMTRNACTQQDQHPKMTGGLDIKIHLSTIINI